MEQTTRIELANQSDLVAVRLGVMESEEVPAAYHRRRTR